MILYILLAVFAGLMTFIAFGLTIGGLIKKKQTLWISSLTGFVFFSLLTVYASYTYVKESINYMGTDEFQAETKKKAENFGKTWGNTVSGTAQGIEATLDDEAISKLANKGANIIGNGVKAIAQGIDESAGKTLVFADESIVNKGITIGRAQHIWDSTKHSYGLYLAFEKDFEGELVLSAYDSEGLKKDNAELNIKQLAGNGKVYVFQFEYFRPGLSGYCILKSK